MRQLGVRWTIGDVSDRGFEALRLSMWGAFRLFGPDAAYAVCVNSIPVEAAREKAGDLPDGFLWHDATCEVPEFLAAHFDAGMAEGCGWKFAPLQFFPDRYELSLDNDCILWEMPGAIRQWLETDDARACVAAEDVAPYFGQFGDFCEPHPRNGGIRGLPPGFDLEAALQEVLEAKAARDGQRVVLTSELDEQGLQTAALQRSGHPFVVTTEEVTICSPFYPHQPHLGRCGAHFVGLNARHIPWDYYDRPADDCMTDHWNRHRSTLYERVGLPRPK
ncbi:MAG: hypothetical protein KY468_11135 [Armatimonadetes bacterium]|nr:hypothetical protein [Armatimonadota bacterium]